MPTCVATADASNLRINATTPATPQTRQDTNSGSKFVMTYPGSTVRSYGEFVCPPNWLTGTITVRARVRVPVSTTGTCNFNLQYLRLQDGSATSGTGALVTVAFTAPGTANTVAEVVFTGITGPTATNTLAYYGFYISRTTADSIGGDIDLLDYDVEYTFDPTIQKQYIFLPANVFLALAGSPSTFGGALTVMASGIDPYAHRLPDSAGNKLGVHVQLPSVFTGGLKSYIMGASVTTGSVNLGLAMGNAAVGAVFDATLTTDTFTTTTSFGAGGNNIFGVHQRNAPISPSAGDMLSLQLTRDNTDANTGTYDFFGILLEFNVFTASPCNIIGLSPECWSAPTSGASSLLAVADTNNTKYVQRFTQGVDQKCNSKRIMPSIYVSGGTLRGYLITTAVSGTIKMRIDYSSPAIAASSDPTPTTGTVINVPVTGAGQLLMFTADVSTALLALDEVILTMNRIGSSDSCAADVDYVEGHIEVSVGA